MLLQVLVLLKKKKKEEEAEEEAEAEVQSAEEEKQKYPAATTTRSLSSARFGSHRKHTLMFHFLRTRTDVVDWLLGVFELFQRLVSVASR